MIRLYNVNQTLYPEYKNRMDNQDTQLEQGATPENNQTAENHNMESLLEQEGLGIDFPAQGEIRTGMIASISTGQILVSVGTKSEGVITV
jgi:small subunit ribosomal protein S1